MSELKAAWKIHLRKYLTSPQQRNGFYPKDGLPSHSNKKRGKPIYKGKVVSSMPLLAAVKPMLFG